MYRDRAGGPAWTWWQHATLERMGIPTRMTSRQAQGSHVAEKVVPQDMQVGLDQLLSVRSCIES